MRFVDQHELFIPLSTGTAGWGIAWYLNGLLIPSVTVFRGTTYTFVTEGGDDPADQSRYHPFYITDSEKGGFLEVVMGTVVSSLFPTP